MSDMIEFEAAKQFILAFRANESGGCFLPSDIDCVDPDGCIEMSCWCYKQAEKEANGVLEAVAATHNK